MCVVPPITLRRHVTCLPQQDCIKFNKGFFFLPNLVVILLFLTFSIRLLLIRVLRKKCKKKILCAQAKVPAANKLRRLLEAEVAPKIGLLSSLP